MPSSGLQDGLVSVALLPRDQVMMKEEKPRANYQANLYVIGFACSKKDKIMSIRRDKREFLENEFDLNL